jgi:antitoxin ParD1/3/4
MADVERLTVTMPAEMLAIVKAAVSDGDYASTSEVIREALRDWKMKRALQLQEFVALKDDIQQGLADVANGRMTEFNADQIIELGRKSLASRSPTA